MRRLHGKENLPIKAFDTLWFYLMPFLCGTAGAELNFSLIDSSTVRKSFVIIFAALIIRFIVTYFVGFAKRILNWKERVFIAVAWISKGAL